MTSTHLEWSSLTPEDAEIVFQRVRAAAQFEYHYAHVSDVQRMRKWRIDRAMRFSPIQSARFDNHGY
jgi:hypothetical protein